MQNSADRWEAAVLHTAKALARRYFLHVQLFIPFTPLSIHSLSQHIFAMY